MPLGRAANNTCVPHKAKSIHMVVCRTTTCCCHVPIWIPFNAARMEPITSCHLCLHMCLVPHGVLLCHIAGLIKRYRVDCMDAEILQANVDRDAFPTCVVAQASELNRYKQLDCCVHTRHATLHCYHCLTCCLISGIVEGNMMQTFAVSSTQVLHMSCIWHSLIPFVMMVVPALHVQCRL